MEHVPLKGKNTTRLNLNFDLNLNLIHGNNRFNNAQNGRKYHRSDHPKMEQSRW